MTKLDADGNKVADTVETVFGGAKGLIARLIRNDALKEAAATAAVASITGSVSGPLGMALAGTVVEAIAGFGEQPKTPSHDFGGERRVNLSAPVAVQPPMWTHTPDGHMECGNCKTRWGRK